MAAEEIGNIQPVDIVAASVAITATLTPNSATFATNQKNVAVAGTGENLPAQAVPNGFSLNIKAKRGNTGSIWLSNSKANAENHAVAYELKPGEQIVYNITNANLVWIDADVSGNGVDFTAET